MADIRVGVLGATGYIGTPYRAELREVEGVQIVGVNARRRPLLEQAAATDGATLISDRWEDIVTCDDINLVIVGTPDALHYEPVLACAEAGKHVLCEKPVGRNATEAAAMFEAYQARPELAHFVPFWTRYVDIFRRAKEIVEDGRLGEIKGVVYRWHNPRPANMPLTWRDNADLSAGGSIADVGSHAYDTVCWLLGDEARRVLTHADTISPPKADLGDINLDEALEWGAGDSSARQTRKGTTPDYAAMAWEFQRGAVGHLMVSHSTWFRKGLCPELELHGTDASLAINRVTGDVLLGTPDQPPEQMQQIPDNGFGNRFERYVIPVIRSIMTGTTPDEHPSLLNGWRVQRFTDAALRSAQEGGWIHV